MQYPYYIVQEREGRLPCPPQYRNTTIAKEFTSGRIGGSRLKENKTTDPQEAYATWSRNRQATIYIVEGQGRPRRRVRIEELCAKIRSI